MPPWALAVAETHPRGLTGRVGAGQRPGLPRDEARFSSRRLGRNPQAALSHLIRRHLVTEWLLGVKNWMSFCGGCRGRGGGWETAAQRTGAESRKLRANGAADTWGDAVNSSAAKAISPR